jgi:hypothetical protein
MTVPLFPVGPINVGSVILSFAGVSASPAGPVARYRMVLDGETLAWAEGALGKVHRGLPGMWSAFEEKEGFHLLVGLDPEYGTAFLGQAVRLGVVIRSVVSAESVASLLFGLLAEARAA